MGKLRKVLRKVLMPVAVIIKDQRRKQPVTCYRRYKSLSKGFISKSSILYGLNQKNYKQYLSDYQLIKTNGINHEASYYLNNKVAFVNMLQGVVEMPKRLAIIKEGKLIPQHAGFGNVSQLLAYLQEDMSRKVVIKPVCGEEGRGVSLVKWEKDYIQVNAKRMTESEFTTYVSSLDDYFISEFIQQGQFSQKLFADSLNTIRILTMIDQTTQKAFIAASALRVGTKESAPTDNFRRHGLSLEVDPWSGRLGKAAMIPEKGRVAWHEIHPDTGVQLTNLVVPHWDSVKEDILTVANFVYQTRGISYVGWDVVLTDQGISLLEGNSWPGVSLHQVHRPLLANSKVKAFYQYFGAVK